jgi:hypothetical protein
MRLAIELASLLVNCGAVTIIEYKQIEDGVKDS